MGPVCMCAVWWGVPGRGVDEYVMCVWCVGRRWSGMVVQESTGVLACDNLCVWGGMLHVHGSAVWSTMPLAQLGRRLWRRIWRV
jgi:hypothetical protein